MKTIVFYAPWFGVLFLVLSIRTILLRRRLKVAVGDGGKLPLRRAMRVHANFAEYVPISLLLIFLLEQQGASATSIHLLCGTLLLGRILHAIGVSQLREKFGFRVVGMVLTFGVIISTSLRLLMFSFQSLY